MAESEEVQAGHNVPKPEEIQEAIKRVLNLHGDLATMKGAYMSECKVVREDIKQVYKDAKAMGIDVKALKAKIKIIELEKKIEETKYGLDGDQFTMLEIIDEAVPSKLGANDNQDVAEAA